MQYTMALNSSRRDKQLVFLSVLLFLLATFCFTHGSPAVRRRNIIRKSPAPLITGCESMEFAIQNVKDEAEKQIYSGHLRLDKTMLFELSVKSVYYDNGPKSKLIRNVNATCVKTINTSYDTCEKSENYAGLNLHSLAELRPYLLLWHFPLPANHCMLLIFKPHLQRTQHVKNKLYYLTNGNTETEIYLDTGKSKTLFPLYNRNNERQIVTVAFHSETGAAPMFELYFKHADIPSAPHNCKCRR